ncbi:hypothetical protein A8L34_05065 [Bacillus sp. FJAT-27264]|uniref:hypothetical protein n=1 Tax=Paenibacillus sp. (strain DSM 101736 / FJAT-27264) TaxID=1850362 RepID=UPI000807FB83|nr:hypothetical protein [Bacillus sp. FJAT-27264]OBZ18921.1 hypothetical protein A8L34_05065 [Bacillus sp. FJAT-27264]
MKKMTILLLILLILGCSSNAKKKLIVTDLINAGNWKEANKNLDNEDFFDIENWKGMHLYVDARLEYDSSDEVTYESIVSKLDEINLDSYDEELESQIKEFKSEIMLLKEKERKEKEQAEKEKEQQEMNKTYNETWGKIKIAMNNGEFSKVASYAFHFEDVDKEFNAIYNYANYHVSGQDDNEYEMISYLTNIPIEYEGKYADIIMKEKLIYYSVDEWRNKEKEAEIQRNKKPPHIGMTADELYESTWRSPKDINKTTNSYGTSEQWVYGNGRYVYLDNGIVTSIQE